MSKQILVVDDDTGQRHLVRLMFERRGFTVLEAEHAFAALALLEHVTPDLLILDLMMPGMDGFELCKAIRERPELSRVPIIFYSANPAWRLDQPWHETGANDFVTKSTPPAQFIESVQRLLQPGAMNASNSRTAS